MTACKWFNDRNKNRDFIFSDAEASVECTTKCLTDLSHCMVECDIDDFNCKMECNKVQAECSKNCPCMENCPNGCADCDYCLGITHFCDCSLIFCMQVEIYPSSKVCVWSQTRIQTFWLVKNIIQRSLLVAWMTVTITQIVSQFVTVYLIMLYSSVLVKWVHFRLISIIVF